MNGKENSPPIRVRFAPSPTGPFHIGGARSALFNYLMARKYGGQFIVRIEDTDLERSSPASEENILQSLRWLGLNWDEGIQVGGDYGPYRQTERLELYKAYTQKLLAEGKAYYCYCTEEELEAERKELLARGANVAYQGKCRDLDSQAQRALEAEGRKPAVRFRIATAQPLIVEDMVRGSVSFDSHTMGDYVIVKSDGVPVYNFACVIDDALMKITHVIRGEEHLSNTPRQLLLYQALGLTPPKFAHVSLILGKDRSKMSKRHGATSINAYREIGYLPEALLNFLVLLGWSPPGEEEIYNLEELVQLFSLERVAKNPAVFDLDKLRWINGHYIRQAPIKQLTAWSIPYLQDAGIFSSTLTPKEEAWVELLATAVRERLDSLSEIVSEARALLQAEAPPKNAEAQAVLLEEHVGDVLTAFKQSVEELVTPLDIEQAKSLLKQVTKKTKLRGRKVFMPLRVGLTGKMQGAELYYLIPLLGKKGCLHRIKAAMQVQS